jgi:hypothetical protein
MHFIIICKQSKDAEIKKTSVEPWVFFLIHNYFSTKCQLSVSDTVIYFAIDFGDVEMSWPKKEHLLANVLFSHIKCGIISFQEFYIFFTAANLFLKIGIFCHRCLGFFLLNC